VFFDKVLQSIPIEPFIEEVQNILSQSPSFRLFYDLRYRNVYIGRHVLSSVLRRLQRGSIEFSDPDVLELLKRLLPMAMQSVKAAELILNKIQPQIVLFNERGYTPYGEIFDVAVNHGINTIQWGQSYRIDAIVFKRYTEKNRDIHQFSLSPDSWRLVQRMPWTDRENAELMKKLKEGYEQGTWFSRKYLHVGKKLKSALEVREQLCLDPTKKTAVIFSHVLWDATFFYGVNLFDDYEQWLVETVRVACANPSINWVVKVHPDYVWKMKRVGDSAKPGDLIALSAKIGQLPDHIKVLEPDTDISTFSLFDVTDYCLTVRGTIGIEMSCFGIPVFTAGTGRYSNLGFTIDSSSREDYLAKLEHIQDFPRLTPEETLLAKKHAYALFMIRPCKFQTVGIEQMSFYQLGHPLDHNVIIRADSFSDIMGAEDLRIFADWAVDSQEIDFLPFLP
jgi:hypothetical protein